MAAVTDRQTDRQRAVSDWVRFSQSFCDPTRAHISQLFEIKACKSFNLSALFGHPDLKLKKIYLLIVTSRTNCNYYCIYCPVFPFPSVSHFQKNLNFYH